MQANVSTPGRYWNLAVYGAFILAVLSCGCRDTEESPSATAPPADQAPAPASRTAAGLATLRAHWDSEVITGPMVDEIKKVLDAGAPEDLEPLLNRLELLEESGDAYAPDFALWWEERGRNELGGKLFWRRDLLHQSLTMAMEGRQEAEMMGLLREAAETGDPVARLWQAFVAEEMPGRHDGGELGSIVVLIDEVRGLVESGDADAAYFLGLFAAEGDMDLIGGSPEEVIGWLEMAAEADNAHAALLLAEAYSRGRNGIPRDPEKAAQWAAKASVDDTTGALSKNRAATLRARSQNNLKQLGLVMKMFANESRGMVYPPLTSLRGHLAMDGAVIYPEYFSDTSVYVSPAHPDYYHIVNIAETDAPAVISDHSYWYLGFLLPDEATGLAFVKHFAEEAKAGRRLEENLELESGTIYRLREGVERFLITDINEPQQFMPNTIPVMIERPGFHEGGASVLFMDGHVEFISYPGKYPMTEGFIQALESLEEVREHP